MTGSTATYTCKECGERVTGFGAFGKHRQAHRAAARAVDPRPPAISRPTRRRIEDVGNPVAEPVASDPVSAPEPDPGVDAPSLRRGPGRPRRTPDVAQPSIRISPEMRTASVADAVRDALDEETIAGIVHALSVAISVADGAGEAGHLSKIQSAQVAHLIYDPTISFVVNRFGGNVDNFKAGLAVLLIVIGKGGVHARAIGARISERRNPAPIAPPIAAGVDQTHQPEPTPIRQGRPGSVDRAPQPGGLSAQLAGQKAAFAGTPGNAE